MAAIDDKTLAWVAIRENQNNFILFPLDNKWKADEMSFKVNATKITMGKGEESWWSEEDTSWHSGKERILRNIEKDGLKDDVQNEDSDESNESNEPDDNANLLLMMKMQQR